MKYEDLLDEGERIRQHFLRLQYLEGANWVTMMNHNENAKKTDFFFFVYVFFNSSSRDKKI